MDRVLAKVYLIRIDSVVWLLARKSWRWCWSPHCSNFIVRRKGRPLIPRCLCRAKKKYGIRSLPDKLFFFC